MKSALKGLEVLPAILLAGSLAACGSGDEPRPGNQRPEVFLEVPPIAQRLSYATTFHWAGADSDGVIDHFDYAIDIPENITMDQIDDPGDNSVSWESTTATEMRFVFSTPTPDTIIAGGTVIVREADVGDHCFYVRAVDDEGLPSKAKFYCFTAENVHPRTTLDVACPGISSIIQLNRRIRLSWLGQDPDGPEPEKKPAYHEWKRIRLSGSVLTLPPDDLTQVVHEDGADFDWVRSDTGAAIVEFAAPGSYLVAIRAVDENGGREDRFRRGVNAVVIIASELFPGGPRIHVTTAGGSHFFPDGGVWNLETPVSAGLSFEMTASAEDYCGVVTGVGCDGGGGGDVIFQPPNGPVTCDLSRLTAGIHVVNFAARDDLGQTTTGTLTLNVIGFPLDRDVLYVDDYRQSNLGGITDAMMDARVEAMLEDAGVTEFYRFDVWGDGDLNTTPEALKLSDLARYRLVLWSVNGAGVTASTGLSEATQCSRVLETYSQAGGAVWIYGQSVWGTFEQMGTTECRGQLTYDELTPLVPSEGSFSCNFLHLCGGDIRNARRQPASNGLVRALPTAGGLTELFPELEIDSTLMSLPYIPFVDALFQPVFNEGLDTVYTMRAPAANSTFNNRPVAFRYADPNPVPSQGPVAIFGFPFHLLKPGSAASRTGVHGMARSMIEWFRSHEGGGS